VSRRIRTGVSLSEIRRPAEEQCVEPSFEGDQQWRRDDVRWQSVANARSCGDCQGAVADVIRRVGGTCSLSVEEERSRRMVDEKTWAAVGG